MTVVKGKAVFCVRDCSGNPFGFEKKVKDCNGKPGPCGHALIKLTKKENEAY